MIRFSAFLVAVAVGLLVAGVVTSKLMLVYIAIGVSGVALLALGIGAAVNWRELTGKPTTAAAEASAPGPAQVPEAAVPEAAARETAVREPAVPEAAVRETAVRETAVPAAAGAAATGSGWPVAVPATTSGPSRAGYLPTGQPQQANPAAARPAAPAAPAAPFPPAVQAPAAFTPRREPPARDAARDIWEWREDSVQAPPSSRSQGPPQPAAASAADHPDDAEPAATASNPGSAAAIAAVSAADATASPQAEESEQAPERAGQPEQAKEPDPAGPDPSAEVTVVPGVPRYHNARCILIRFMGESDLDTMTRATARDAGCTPCRACLPDQPDKSPE